MFRGLRDFRNEGVKINDFTCISGWTQPLNLLMPTSRATCRNKTQRGNTFSKAHFFFLSLFPRITKRQEGNKVKAQRRRVNELQENVKMWEETNVSRWMSGRTENQSNTTENGPVLHLWWSVSQWSEAWILNFFTFFADFMSYRFIVTARIRCFLSAGHDF